MKKYAVLLGIVLTFLHISPVVAQQLRCSTLLSESNTEFEIGKINPTVLNFFVTNNDNPEAKTRVSIIVDIYAMPASEQKTPALIRILKQLEDSGATVFKHARNAAKSNLPQDGVSHFSAEVTESILSLIIKIPEVSLIVPRESALFNAVVVRRRSISQDELITRALQELKINSFYFKGGKSERTLARIAMLVENYKRGEDEISRLKAEILNLESQKTELVRQFRNSDIRRLDDRIWPLKQRLTLLKTSLEEVLHHLKLTGSK